MVAIAEEACRLLVEQSFPIVSSLALSRWEEAPDGTGLYEKEFLEKLQQRSEELIQTQKELVETQKELVSLQRQLLEKREEVISSVKSTAETEIKSFSGVLKKGCATALAPQRLRSAMAVVSEDRGCNLVVHGLAEENKEDMSAEIGDLLSALSEKPPIQSVERLGKPNDNATWPVKEQRQPVERTE